MKNTIKNWFLGYVKIEIKGENRYRLINICKRNNISFNNFTSDKDVYSAVVSYRDYKFINILNKKTKTDIKIIDKIGLPFFFYKYKKRKIFLLCIIIFFIMIYSFTFFIWNISIIGNHSYTKEELLKDINDNYIPIGTPISKIDCNLLEKKLMNKYNKLAWISCEIKGTNLIIDLKETIDINTPITYDKPCNIIAFKDGIITELIINGGQKVANIGDEIKKNDVLITGVVNVYNEYDELLETNYIPAKGNVNAIVTYDYYDEFSLYYTNKEHTGNEIDEFTILVGNNMLKIPSKGGEYKLSDTIEESNKIRLFGNLYLPIGYSKSTTKEYILKSSLLSDEDAVYKARERLIIYIDNLKKKGVSILENNVKIRVENQVCIASGTIVCEESIGIPAEIEIIDKGEEP